MSNWTKTNLPASALQFDELEAWILKAQLCAKALCMKEKEYDVDHIEDTLVKLIDGCLQDLREAPMNEASHAVFYLQVIMYFDAEHLMYNVLFDLT